MDDSFLNAVNIFEREGELVRFYLFSSKVSPQCYKRTVS